MTSRVLTVCSHYAARNSAHLSVPHHRRWLSNGCHCRLDRERLVLYGPWRPEQRQRIRIAPALALALALALEPQILEADQPVCALDVSIQAQILQRLADIRERLQLSIIFITDDLRVAAQVCDRIAVMRLGKTIEEGPTAALFRQASHPHTRELLDAVPGKQWIPDSEDGGRA